MRDHRNVTPPPASPMRGEPPSDSFERRAWRTYRPDGSLDQEGLWERHGPSRAALPPAAPWRAPQWMRRIGDWIVRFSVALILTSGLLLLDVVAFSIGERADGSFGAWIGLVVAQVLASACVASARE